MRRSHWWHNLDIRMSVKLHELDKASIDGTSRYALKAVDGGVKTSKNNSKKHPITERHHLRARRRWTRNNFVCGAHIFKSNLANLQAPISLKGVKEETLEGMYKIIVASASDNILDEPF